MDRDEFKQEVRMSILLVAILVLMGAAAVTLLLGLRKTKLKEVMVKRLRFGK